MNIPVLSGLPSFAAFIVIPFTNEINAPVPHKINFFMLPSFTTCVTTGMMFFMSIFSLSK